jgi:hypothetical protein
MNKFLSLITLLLIALSIKAQEDKNTDNLNVTETIKLNTDRELYFSGENIYFNASYFINGAKTKPTLSNVIYIELIDCSNNKPIVQQKYQINNFNVNNKIAIPSNIISGNYMLRAFTQYQRNLRGFKYTYKLLTLLNPGYDPLSQNKQINEDSIYIAPKGGILLDNIINDVVIHIPDIYISDSNHYYIKDHNNNILNKLKPNSFGLIQTEMAFNGSLKYIFVINRKDDDHIITRFPEIKQEGTQTAISVEQYNINYKIYNKGISQNTQFKLKVLSSKFIETYSQDITITNTEMNIGIAKNQLKNGLYYFILTHKNEIKNINTCYIPGKCNSVDIEASKEIYNPKEIIDIWASIDKITDMPIVSVSIAKNGTNISDHKYNEGLYASHPVLLENFLNNCKEASSELVNQLLVLADNHMNKEKFNEYLFSRSNTLDYIPETRNLTITGILRNKTTKDPIANHKVYLSVLFKNPQLHIYTTRENGEFIFSLNNVFEKNDIYLCSEDPTNKEDEYEILVKSSFPSDIPDFTNIPLFVNEKDVDLIGEVYRNMQIQENFQQNNKLEPINSAFSNEFNLNDNKLTIDPNKYVDFENMEELFYEIVPNVIVKKDKDNYSFRVLDENDYTLIGTPLILVDHVPIFNVNKIMKLNPAQIEKIEVLYKPYILGSHKINGVVMITTNTENFAEIKLPKTSTFLEYEALNNPVDITEFNFTATTAKSSIPDFRTTLYWNPALKFDTNKKQIKLLAPDSKGIYNITIVGYDSNGEKFYGEKQITIE